MLFGRLIDYGRLGSMVHLPSYSSQVSCLEQLFVYVLIFVSQRDSLLLFGLREEILHRMFKSASDPGAS